MATAVGLRMVGKHGSSWVQNRDGTMKKKVVERNGFRVSCSYSHRPSSVMDPYKTLRIDPSASEAEVKKAFRKLALQMYAEEAIPGVQFHLINEAYHAVMSKLRRRSNDSESYDEGASDPIRGTDGPDWELWEEWMGWEGAGIRDYSSHINPYI